METQLGLARDDFNKEIEALANERARREWLTTEREKLAAELEETRHCLDNERLNRQAEK
jgi:hypothetical protein